jgi:DNA-binding CsgD family transcriptional regulator
MYSRSIYSKSTSLNAISFEALTIDSRSCKGRETGLGGMKIGELGIFRARVSSSSTVRPIRVSRRQAEILALVAADLSTKQIARRLGISTHTVAKHLERVFLRNHLHSRAAAVATWLSSERF